MDVQPIRITVPRYTLTDYPNIYRRQHWGDCPVPYQLTPDKTDVIENRNKFVEDYGIIKNRDCIPQYALRLANLDWMTHFRVKKDRRSNIHDHMEFYESDNHFIVVLSPYAGALREGDYEMALEQGYEPYLMMYNDNAVTLIKSVPKRG